MDTKRSSSGYLRVHVNIWKLQVDIKAEIIVEYFKELKRYLRSSSGY